MATGTPPQAVDDWEDIDDWQDEIATTAVPTPESMAHAKNVGAEVQAGIPGELLKRTASAFATVPRVLGSVGGAVPLIGAPLGALGETAAQGIEMAGGAREGSPFDPSAYNKTEIGMQAGLGAIPGGIVAKTFKPATRTGARIAGGIEGAAMGSGSTAVSAAAQGRLPNPEELAIGAGLGGTLGAATGGYQGARQALPLAESGQKPPMWGMGSPRSDYTEKAHKQLYAAIQPEAGATREFSEHLNAALPYIYANRKGNVNSIADMEQAARGTMRRLWNLHIEPVVAMNNHKVVPTDDIANSLRSQINRDTPKSVRKQIETAAALYDRPRSLGDLNNRIRELNAETRGLQESTGKSARTLRNDPKTAWKFQQLNMLRSTLAEQAGEITGDASMYMKLRKDWGALSEVADEAGEAAKRWEHQKKIEGAGAVPGVQRIVKSVKGGLGFGGAAAVRRGLTEGAIEYMANPDRQVKGAFKRLRFGQRMSSQFPDAPPMAERKALPAMGETGEPSLGDLQYRMPDDPAAAKHARQRREGSRLLTGQTRDEFANQPAPGQPQSLAPGEMELSPGQIPRNPSAARPSPITLKGGAPVEGQTVPMTIQSTPVPNPYLGAERRRSTITPEQAAEEQAARRAGRFIERRRPTMAEAAISGEEPPLASWLAFQGADPTSMAIEENIARQQKAKEIYKQQYGKTPRRTP